MFIVPTNHTRTLEHTTPPWGERWSLPSSRFRGLSGRSRSSTPWTAAGQLQYFQQTHWKALQHVVVHSLARHPRRTRRRKSAQFCVVAAPPREGGVCESWDSLCPGLPLVVIDHVDADDTSWKYCPDLWECGRKQTNTSLPPKLIRVVGAGAVYSPRHRRCNTTTMPWLSHARTGLAATVNTRARGVRIAFAAGVRGHAQAHRRGFEAWRRDLRDSCAHLGNGSVCAHMYQSLVGGMARGAVELYSRAVFCLHPPGDTMPRSGIVDALSVGCIPVLFHRAQVCRAEVRAHAPSCLRRPTHC